MLSTDKCLASPPGHTSSSDGNNKSVPAIHISQPNVIKVYGNSQVRSQLTLVHQAVYMDLYLVPLIGGCGVGLNGWVAGRPPLATGHCSLAWPPLLILLFLISPFQRRFSSSARCARSRPFGPQIPRFARSISPLGLGSQHMMRRPEYCGEDFFQRFFALPGFPVLSPLNFLRPQKFIHKFTLKMGRICKQSKLSHNESKLHYNRSQRVKIALQQVTTSQIALQKVTTSQKRVTTNQNESKTSDIESKRVKNECNVSTSHSYKLTNAE